MSRGLIEQLKGARYVIGRFDLRNLCLLTLQRLVLGHTESILRDSKLIAKRLTRSTKFILFCSTLNEHTPRHSQDFCAFVLKQTPDSDTSVPCLLDKMNVNQDATVML